MTSSRKKPGVLFWATVVVVAVLLAYPLSFGPACWIGRRGLVSAEAARMFYRPIVSAMIDGPLPVRDFLRWYAGYSLDQISSFDSKLTGLH